MGNDQFADEEIMQKEIDILDTTRFAIPITTLLDEVHIAFKRELKTSEFHLRASERSYIKKKLRVACLNALYSVHYLNLDPKTSGKLLAKKEILNYLE